MDEEKILNVTQLQVVDKLQNEYVILLIRDTGNGKQCFQIRGFDFRGESAYEAAHRQAIEELTDIADVLQYDFKEGYPDKLEITL